MMKSDAYRIAQLEDKIDTLFRRIEPFLNHTNFETYIKYMIEDVWEESHVKIRIPHRCPICIGSTYDDKEGAFCIPCDGRGIVWG